MRALLLVSLLALAACDTFEGFPPVAVDGVSLETDGPDDGLLSTVGLVLRNEGARPVEAGACAAVEARVGAGWSGEGLGDRPCDLPDIVLQPGGSRVEHVDTSGLPNGTYRFVQETSVGTVASSSLRVDR